MLKKDHLEQRGTLFERVPPLSSSMREEIEKTFLRPNLRGGRYREGNFSDYFL